MKLLILLQVAALIFPDVIHAQLNTTTTPPGCRKLPTDADWPDVSVWREALPGVIATNGSDEHGPIPDYRLQAKSVEDVQKAVRFAKNHNIRLSVITTGHDQLLRSYAGSGLLLDLSLFQGSHAAVSFGPAVAGLPLNYAVADSGLFTVSGGAATVAVAGGWGQNGGYGPLTAQYGLGVDQWLEALIVTPDGKLRVANSEVNTDLFWAIRGGGGGTFGVVVQATWKAHPVVPITGYNWYINSTLDTSDLEPGTYPTSAALRHLLREAPGLYEKGISVTYYVRPTHIRAFAIHPGTQAGINNANDVWGPILSNVSSLPGITPFQTRAFEFNNYKEFFEGTYGELVPQPTAPEYRYGRGIIPYDSRLFSAEHLTSPNITNAFVETGGSVGVQIMTPGQRFGDGSDTSANPGWRKAVAFVIATTTETTNANGLRRLAPDMGTYINEGSVLEENWKSSFWGSNYPRLSELKRKYDPEMTLWISPGINADYMYAVDNRACLVSPTSTTPSTRPPATERWHPADLNVDRDFLFGKQELTGNTFPAPGTELGVHPA
ncbi:hypothetical protein C7974DRAFT_307458 [Boeremia exigua]|uniref:uncharacterized protein n=1 Tax=Boeremia exigua TaxID=749465 RepID=UPI001E8CA16B|nr:uncharacterized protein C7974DRAFT_307458 [Boeremia exigua]KAH6638496.1 hypothetical protein C7974DRAFT_307458 [Boeremia exigua]